MDNKEKIKIILKEGIKEYVNRIAIFDFDGTLIDTPTQDSGMQIYAQKTGKPWPHKGWWSKPESLDMNIFEMPEIKQVISEYKKERARPYTLMVMMTGRMKQLAPLVEKVLTSKGLKFDEYIYNMGGSTLDSKLNSLNNLLIEYPDVKSVIQYDDRGEHISVFKDFGVKLVNDNRLASFDAIHVK